MTYVDPALPRSLQGDPVRLRQVLLNLTSNAIKFTENGEVLIRVTPVVAVGEEADAEHVRVCFEVIDTGIGLSEAARKLLFQPFVQGDGSTSRKYGGTGLGLSISKRLVELMNGEMGVESSLANGSRFWFTVPFRCHRFAVDTFEDLLPKSTSALIWDCSASSAAVLHHYLNNLGVSTKLASSEKQAIEMLRESAQASQLYDLVFVGIAKGAEQIKELPRIVRQDPALQKTHLILVTPFDDKERTEAGQEQGFSVSLTKPIRQSQLLETISRILGGAEPDCNESG